VMAELYSDAGYHSRVTQMTSIASTGSVWLNLKELRPKGHRPSGSGLRRNHKLIAVRETNDAESTFCHDYARSGRVWTAEADIIKPTC
jgi:hypothetical protein